MGSENDWIGKGPWRKTAICLGGTLHYGSKSVDSNRIKKQPGIAEISRLSKQALISKYLCAGKNSSCVRSQRCECLAACKYGQRYLQLAEEERSE